MPILPHDEYLKKIKEPDSVLICMPGDCEEFPDSITGKCDDCGCVIHYRPYNKDATKKICTNCALNKKKYRKGEIRVSEITIDEVAEKLDNSIAS